MLRQLANFAFYKPFAFYIARKVEKSTKESLAYMVIPKTCKHCYSKHKLKRGFKKHFSLDWLCKLEAFQVVRIKRNSNSVTNHQRGAQKSSDEMFLSHLQEDIRTDFTIFISMKV